jgi:hypothetical protein
MIVPLSGVQNYARWHRPLTNKGIFLALSPMAQNADKSEQNRYASRGVSATKGEVHAAVDKLNRGLFPGAFCKITPDYLTGDSSRCAVTHSDGSGTKSNSCRISGGKKRVMLKSLEESPKIAS